MKKSALLFLAIPLFLLTLSTSAQALTIPERLVYDVSWTGIKAGIAVQEVTAQGGDLHIVSTARSMGWLTPIFQVNDRTESIISRDVTEGFATPKFYREKINEGGFHTDKEAKFDATNCKVETKDHLKKTEKTDTISARTFDSLSAIYFVRATGELVVGKSIFIDIYDCKRLWHTEVQVLKREEISTPLGRFKTIVVKPLLKAEGFFARTGEVMVWLTDDSLRIPVKMTTKLKLGRITAVLAGGSYWPEQ